MEFARSPPTDQYEVAGPLTTSNEDADVWGHLDCVGLIPNLLARQLDRVLRIVPIQKRHVPLKLDDVTYVL